jgi:hypothetical protein
VTRSALAELVRTRRLEVEEGSQLLSYPMQPPGQPFYWVDAAWLKAWADSTQLPSRTLRTDHLVRLRPLRCTLCTAMNKLRIVT